jgi:hypothetical protein
MKLKFKSEISETLFRLRIDNHDYQTLQKWFLKETIKIYLCTAELASATQKKHMHVVFMSDKKITALRTSFRKMTNLTGSEYSFSQNWSKETKSKDMKLYMLEHELTYQDIHIIYILKDSDIKLNTLIDNPEELDFEKIRKTIGCKSKKQKKYGNYTKKLIMDYNELYPEPLIDVNCGSLDDFPEKERIFKFVTQQTASHNLDIFLSHAKKFDDYVIKMLCQTVLNTRKYGGFYPDAFRDEILKYYL